MYFRLGSHRISVTGGEVPRLSSEALSGTTCYGKMHSWGLKTLVFQDVHRQQQGLLFSTYYTSNNGISKTGQTSSFKNHQKQFRDTKKIYKGFLHPEYVLAASNDFYMYFWHMKYHLAQCLCEYRILALYFQLNFQRKECILIASFTAYFKSMSKQSMNKKY